MVLPRLVSLKQLSEMYQISVPQLRKLIKSGLPHRRIARKIWVKPAEFEVWFDENYTVVNDKAAMKYDNMIDKIISQVMDEKP